MKLVSSPTGADGGLGQRTTVSAVIPALNEEASIAWVLDRLPSEVDEVIVVDGHSTDDTVAVARRSRPDVRVLQGVPLGKGSALRAGFAAARGDVVVMLDADGSMDPREIGRHLAAIEQGFDVVKGSRFMRSGGTTDISRLRAVGNLALLGLANLLFGCRFTELCYGFMAIRREVIPRLHLTAGGFDIESQIVAHALRAGCRVTEVPSFEAPRRHGTSRLRTFRDGARVLRALIAARLRDWPPEPETPERPGGSAGEGRFARPRLGEDVALAPDSVA